MQVLRGTGAGEVLATDASAAAARLPTDGLARRNLELRWRSEPVDVVVVRASEPVAAPTT